MMIVDESDAPLEPGCSVSDEGQSLWDRGQVEKGRSILVLKQCIESINTIL